MPVPIEFLRGVLGILCLFFAYMAGKTYAGMRKGRVKNSRFYGWLVRTVLCALALALRHNIDTIALGVWILAAGLFALGYWEAQREKPPEDLTGEIFPHDGAEPRP
jgi:uncharacterized membrane protein